MRSQLCQRALSDRVVVLRPFVPQNAGRLGEIFSDPEVRRHNDVPATEADAVLRWIRHARGRTARREGAGWAVVCAASGVLVGRRGMWLTGPRSAGTGAFMAPEFRGRRFSPRSLVLAAWFVFQHWAIERVHAECGLDNRSSYCAFARGRKAREGIAPERTPEPDAGRPEYQRVFCLLSDDPIVHHPGSHGRST